MDIAGTAMVSSEGTGFGSRILVQYARNYAAWSQVYSEFEISKTKLSKSILNNSNQIHKSLREFYWKKIQY